MSAVIKARVVLKANKFNVPFFLAVCKAIYAAMNAHPTLFVGSPVAMAFFLSQIQALDGFQTAVKTRVLGAAAARDLARDATYSTAETLRVFVQGLCVAAPEQAATLVEAAGMKLAASRVRSKPFLGVKQGLHTGIVLLAVNVGLLGKAKGVRFFNWEYALDGKTWVGVPSTPKSTTTITGLPALVTCSFRFSVTDNNGQGEWSQVVAFLVH